MGDPHPIISLGDFGKPANTLIEKIADAIGGIFKPHQIVKVAQAEAEAEKIRAVTHIEVTQLERRAMRRLIMEEAKKQNNIETIIGKALPEVDEKAKPEQVEDDWITNFFEKCRLISDEEMQVLWARILAGQANSPGKFSKRTVDLLASMDKADANAFSNLCSFAFRADKLIPLVYDVRNKVYADHGINFGTLSHLESISLIHFDNLRGFLLTGLEQKGLLDYFGERVWIEFPNPENYELQVGKVLFTQAGEQLGPICGAERRDGFVEYIIERWKSLGYKIERQTELDGAKKSTRSTAAP